MSAPSMSDIVDAFFSYEFGEIEFTEMALQAGASLEKINECLEERRAEEMADSMPNEWSDV